MSFATGKHAYGFCERCAQRWPLGDLKAEQYKGADKRNRVCPDCWDEDHPQLFVGTFKIDDPQALQRPVPDIDLSAVNSIPANVRPFGVGVGASTATSIASQFTPENGSISLMQPPGVQTTGTWALFKDDTANSTHGVYSEATMTLTNDITFSAYVYGAGTSGNNEFGLRINDTSDANVWTVIFNFTGVIVGTGFTSGAASLVASSITPQSDGSMLASITVNLGGGTNPARLRLLARRSSVGSVVYIGDGSPFFFYKIDPGYSNP